MMGTIALAGAMMMGLAAPAAAQSYTDVRWDYRPLLVFAPEGDPAIAAQEAALAADAALVRDLKLAVYVVTGDRLSPRFGAPAPQTDAATLRRRFGVLVVAAEDALAACPDLTIVGELDLDGR